jgi:hypothetical protein
MTKPTNTYCWTSDGMELVPFARLPSEWVKAEDYVVLANCLDQRESELRWACEILITLDARYRGATVPDGEFSLSVRAKTILATLENVL